REQHVAAREKLEAHRGHLYNWYDTRSLKPLLPLYVSSVDSGNLAGHLLAVAPPCNEGAMARAGSWRAISTACSTSSPSSRKAWRRCPTTAASCGRSGSGCASASPASGG